MDDISNPPDPAAALQPPLDPSMKAYLDGQLAEYKQSILQAYEEQWAEREAGHRGIEDEMKTQLKAAEEKEQEYRAHIVLLEERLLQLEHRDTFDKDDKMAELNAKRLRGMAEGQRRKSAQQATGSEEGTPLVPARDMSISVGLAARRGIPTTPTPRKTANETPRKSNTPAQSRDDGGDIFMGDFDWDKDEEDEAVWKMKTKQSPKPATPRKTPVNTPRKTPANTPRRSGRHQERWEGEGDEGGERVEEEDPDEPMNSIEDEQWLRDGQEGESEEEEEEDGKRERRRTYQLKKTDIPKDAKGFKEAMEFYVRMCWGLTSAKAIPKPPTSAMLEEYRKNYQSKAAVFAQHRSEGNVLKSIKGVLCLAYLQKMKSKSKIVQQAWKMEEKVVKHVDREFAKMRLPKWCPDLRQSPYSGYNELHRIVLINTFQMVVRTDTFAEYRLNPKYIEDNDFLIRLYDHIVHDFHYRHFMADPAKLEVNEKLNGILHNRLRLGKVRHEFMVMNKYSKLQLRLADSAATSDDEHGPDPDVDVYYIRRRPERSAAAEAFIRDLEEKRRLTAIYSQKKTWRQRERVVPPQGEQEDTYFPSLPEGMPVDYFEPDFYNSLQPSLRSKIAVAEVALLKYDSTKPSRNDVLERYRIPGVSCNDEDQTAQEIEEERETVTAHLSATQMSIG